MLVLLKHVITGKREMLAQLIHPYSCGGRGGGLSSSTGICLLILKKLISSIKYHYNLSVPDTPASLHENVVTKQTLFLLCIF
jgi:hypothetical protein